MSWANFSEGMTMNRRTAFTDAEMTAWSRAMDDKKPEPINEREILAMPQVDAFSVGVLNAGIGFRMATRGGREIEILLSPMVARHLAACILKMGQAAGWLDARADVTPPSVYDS